MTRIYPGWEFPSLPSLARDVLAAEVGHIISRCRHVRVHSTGQKYDDAEHALHNLQMWLYDHTVRVIELDNGHAFGERCTRTRLQSPL